MEQLNLGYLSTKLINATQLKSNQSLGWQISTYNLPNIWKENQGEGIKIGIIDTAIDLRHPDIDIKGGYDFAYNRSINYYKTHYPSHGHGTHVAGIISAKNNNTGIVGVAPKASLYSVVALNEEGSGSYNDLIKSIDWCINNGMDVINMSLGAVSDTTSLYRAIRRAYDANITIVCAGGNSAWAGHLDFPATYNETIAIASIAEDMKRSSFSSIGSNIDVAAPGSNIISCTPNNSYSSYSGTSMASPFVTGIIALLLAKHRKHGGSTPINTVEDVREHLIKTAIDVDYVGNDSYTGYGLINPKESLDYSKPTQPPVTEAPTTLQPTTLPPTTTPEPITTIAPSTTMAPILPPQDNKTIKLSDMLNGNIKVIIDVYLNKFAKIGSTRKLQFKLKWIKQALRFKRKSK